MDGNSLAPRRLRILLSGRFAVISGDGADLTPRGGKNQALLALLAASPDLCRNRRWLQDRLWSDRSEDQASASLRQSLCELRRTLGDAAPALVADRQKIGLALDLVQIDPTPAAGAEFLEGIDVRDPNFEYWLRSERHRRLSLTPMAPHLISPQRPTPSRTAPAHRRVDRRPIVVILQKSRSGSDALSLMEDMFVDCVGLSLREALGIPVHTKRQKPDLPGSILLSVQAFVGTAGERFLRARAVELDCDRLIWAGNSSGLDRISGPADTGLVLFANQVVEVLGDAISLQPDVSSELDALVMQRLAARKLWTMQPDRLIEAESLLRLADEMAPRGLNAARRAQLRVLQLIERHGHDAQVLRDEAMVLCRQAMEREPNNSMVLAVAAYVRSTLDATPEHGAELARRSIRLNPHNPLAWDSLSYARLYAGQIAEAHQIALKVQEIGAAAPNRFWWDMGLCLTAAVTGDEGLALRMAESAAAEAPDFRAALRYVVALNAGQGRDALALTAADRLRGVEPDFNLERLALDRDYPVGILRRAGMLRADRILSISG